VNAVLIRYYRSQIPELTSNYNPICHKDILNSQSL